MFLQPKVLKESIALSVIKRQKTPYSNRLCTVCGLVFLFIMLALTVGCAQSLQADIRTVNITIDLNAPRTPFDHIWERCMGSGHASLTLREDWRQHVRMAHEKLGLQAVRFHGILDDDMSTSIGPGLNSYVNVDSFADFMVANNMSAVVELGFMPRWLARGRDGYSCNHSINHYAGCSDPPSNWTQWGEVVHSLVQHLVDRYGEDEIANNWLFEVWNEPNLNGQRDPLEPPPYPGWQGGGDWWGTGLEYFKLYEYAAKAVKQASKRARVGGPATTGPARCGESAAVLLC
jgi:xylan 1,4-beta-xylosidase